MGKGSTTRATVWHHDGAWWAAPQAEDGCVTGDPVRIDEVKGGTGKRATEAAARLFGVPVPRVVVVAAAFRPTWGEPPPADATARGLLPSGATDGEAWCNHDPAAVHDGRCECGALLRVETLVETVQEWMAGSLAGDTLATALDRLEALLTLLGAPALTDDEAAAVKARLESGGPSNQSWT